MTYNETTQEFSVNENMERKFQKWERRLAKAKAEQAVMSDTKEGKTHSFKVADLMEQKYEKWLRRAMSEPKEKGTQNLVERKIEKLIKHLAKGHHVFPDTREGRWERWQETLEWFRDHQWI